MPYQLRESLSFCRIDGHLVFLDIEGDQYFQLNAPMEQTFMAYIDRGESSNTNFIELVQQNIFTEVSVIEHKIAPPIVKLPARSILEEDSSTHQFDALVFIEVLTIVLATKWQLKVRTLKNILDKLISNRQSRERTRSSGRSEPTEQDLLDAVSLFKKMRRYVPITMSCLLDSLSLVKFLARRRLASTIIVGVTLEPFSAHCWVQVAEWMLNEIPDKAKDYTPIKII